jgi:Mitochondrial resolvase Ydc2 / RNA splicing MRS1
MPGFGTKKCVDFRYRGIRLYIREIMRIVSFDVGIKNLAYCVVTIDGRDTHIRAWTVVDVSGAADVSGGPLCGCAASKKPSSRPCVRPAAFTKNGVFFCKVHASKHGIWTIRPAKKSMVALRKLKSAELAAVCVALGMCGERRSKAEMLTFADVALGAQCFEPLASEKKISASAVDLISVGRHLTRALDAEPELEGVSVVLIENQIGPLANRMKVIQGMITQYFIMKSDSSIFYVYSGNKLKGLGPIVQKECVSKAEEGVIQEAGAPNAPAASGAKTYAKHKSDAVMYARAALEENAEFAFWREGVLNNRKADDYADCFLQALWWIRKEKEA